MKRTCNNKNCFCHWMEDSGSPIDGKLYTSMLTEVYAPKSHWDAFENGTYPHTPIPSWCCQKCGEEIGYLGRLFQFLHMDLHKC